MSDQTENTETTSTENTTPQEQVRNPAARKASAEAAKYRKEAQEAHRELETTQTLLTQSRRQIITQANQNSPTRIDSRALADLLDGGEDITELYNEDGSLDPTKFTQWQTGLLEARPYLKDTRPRGAAVNHQGDQPSTGPNPDRFQNAIMGAHEH